MESCRVAEPCPCAATDYIFLAKCAKVCLSSSNSRPFNHGQASRFYFESLTFYQTKGEGALVSSFVNGVQVTQPSQPPSSLRWPPLPEPEATSTLMRLCLKTHCFHSVLAARPH